MKVSKEVFKTTLALGTIVWGIMGLYLAQWNPFEWTVENWGSFLTALVFCFILAYLSEDDEPTITT